MADEEILYAITKFSGGENRAAYQCIRWLVAKFAGMIDESQAQVDAKWEQLWKHYVELEKLWRVWMIRDGDLSIVMPISLSVSEKDVLWANPDAVRPLFARDRRSPVGDLRSTLSSGGLLQPWPQ